MKALQYVKSKARYVAVRGLGHVWPGVCTSPLSALRLAELDPTPLPAADWVRVRPRLAGICGSDLATIACSGSAYFSAVTSFPFVLGHEVVGEVTELGSAAGSRFRSGQRVVVEPALGCHVRGIEPACAPCAAGAAGGCLNLTNGDIAAGVQTGYCRDTGGGWSGDLVAHVSQLHAVPDDLDDEDAVLVEPLSCSVHAVLRADLAGDETVLILGAGSVGLLTLFALKRLYPGCRAWIAAKYPHQAELARDLGADDVLPAGRALRADVIERTGARRHEPELGQSMVLGGVDATFDCVGAARSIDEAVRLTRSRGTVVLVGMPAQLHGLDGTAMWFQETRILGAYAYGNETHDGREVRTFDLSLEAAAADPGKLARLVTGRFPLSSYRQAIRTAMATGAERAVKTVFDPRL